MLKRADNVFGHSPAFRTILLPLLGEREAGRVRAARERGTEAGI
jgi:hypothetical protein